MALGGSGPLGSQISQAIKLPAGEKSRRGMARAVARMAAERAAANIQARSFHARPTGGGAQLAQLYRVDNKP